MLQRLMIYTHEMFPLWNRLSVAFGLTAGIYYTVLALHGITPRVPHIGELVIVLTVFFVLFCVRIIDEFKDYETDKLHFPKRPLPSGRVKKRDLATLLIALLVVTTVLNGLFVPTVYWYGCMMVYLGLMSVWFFARSVIQPSLLWALVTHNPFQLFLVIYVLLFTAHTYAIDSITPMMALIALVFYFPGLAWELSRKIRAPDSEDQYVTYSRIFGYKKAIGVVLLVFGLQLLALIYLFADAPLFVGLLLLAYCIYCSVSMYAAYHAKWMTYGVIARAYMYSVHTAILLMVAWMLL